MRRVQVEGVRVQAPSNQPVVLLRDLEDAQVLPIWIGAVEASAIAFAQQGVQPPRPLTHDLFMDVIETLGEKLAEVHIDSLRESVFYATLIFNSGKKVGARPSDAIALALRCEARIFVADEVMAEAAILLPDEDEPTPPVEDQEEVERFRAFLDHVSAEDFGDPGGEGGED
jgi:uncharacterized protein